MQQNIIMNGNMSNSFSAFYLKSDSHLQKKCFVCVIESPLEMMKSAFYFILKSLFVLKILNLYRDFLVMQKKRID